LKWADEIGIESVLRQITALYEEYNEDRYRPSVMLKRMVADRRKFY
jgi:3-hydroxybutyryl-CoA dehydrogenase